MEVKIKILTPLWTGGVETGKCDRIHETGLLGSLRWWMEVLVRGVGGHVCDPTKQKCLHDPKKPNNGLCDVCQIFGATGWKRRFRLEVVEDNTQPDPGVSSKIELASYQYQYKDKEGKTQTQNGTPRWWFPDNQKDKPRSGKFIIKIQSLDPKFKPEIIADLLQFIADRSALGARPQMGFGVIQIEGNRINTQHLYDWLISITGDRTYQQLPSLRNIFMTTLKFKNSSFSEEYEKHTFNLKYDLRQLLRSDENLRHFIMGTVKGDRMAAKIKMSRPYEDKNGDRVMRVWGWIPETASVYSDNWDREKVINEIYNHLKNKYEIQDWREFKSSRDTKTPNEGNSQSFLQNLFNIGNGR
ncbi:type III-B CRISPR module RAMP protein Cmr1 [Geitlerinema sp. CS-897]|nr:type III-B CRISPR module RAMP protein Cmr1 [Geitlerinema sp. CS-897]